MIIVYHNKGFFRTNILLMMGVKSASLIDAKQLVPIGITDTNDHGMAIELVDNFEKLWFDDPRVQILEASRSTRTGDVLLEDGEICWLIGDWGLQQIELSRLPEIEHKVQSPLALPQNMKGDSYMPKFNISDLLSDIFLGPPSDKEVQRRTERDKVRVVDKILPIYQEWGLHDRFAVSNIEAAVKLLIERGHYDSDLGRYFANPDFSIHSQGTEIIVDKTGPLIEIRRILVVDVASKSVKFALASLEIFGKFQNLANGQAFLCLFPGARQRSSVAQRCLVHLDEILTSLKGNGDQAIEGNNYRVQRQGQILTLMQSYVSPKGDIFYTNDTRNILLEGHILKQQITISYLSLVDTQRIANTYRRLNNYDLEEAVSDLDKEQFNIPEEILIDIMFAPISQRKLDRSWTLPKGEQNGGPVDAVTTLAIFESALALVNAIQQGIFQDDHMKITKEYNLLRIENTSGETVFKQSLCAEEKLNLAHNITAKLAYHILNTTQQCLPSLLEEVVDMQKAKQVLRATQYLFNDYGIGYTIINDRYEVIILGENQKPVLHGNHKTGEIFEYNINVALATKIIDQAIQDYRFRQIKEDSESFTPAIDVAINPEADVAQNAYKQLELNKRDAQNIYEAALTLLVQQGELEIYDAAIVRRVFENDDFLIMQDQQLSIIYRGSFQNQQEIWIGNGRTGEVHTSKGSLRIFGQLLDLANGEAFVPVCPSFMPEQSAAQICLMHLDIILKSLSNSGHSVIKGTRYQISRQEASLTLTDECNKMILHGNIEQQRVAISYLSSTDVMYISQAYQQVTHYDSEEQMGLSAVVAAIGPCEDIYSQMLLKPVSLMDMERSWTAPHEEIADSPMEPAIINAVMGAAQLILKSIDGKRYKDPNFEVVDCNYQIQIFDSRGKLVLDWGLFGGLNVNLLDGQTAQKILVFVQAKQAEFNLIRSRAKDQYLLVDQQQNPAINYCDLPQQDSCELNILADSKPFSEDEPFIPSLGAIMGNHNLEDCSIFVDHLQIYPHDDPPPAYLIGRVSDFFDQIELQGSLKIQRGDQILFQQDEDQVIIPIADEIKMAIIHYQQYAEMECQGAEEAYLDDLEAGMVPEKSLNHQPGQASNYIIQEENVESTDQSQEFTQAKNLVDDARAQEVFQATRYLISEGFSRGYFTTRDFDNRDIIEYHATQGNILLKGNKITGELLDHCLDEDTAAKIIQDSQFDQVLVKYLDIEENPESQYYREYDFYIDGDKLKIYECDLQCPSCDLIIFGNMASGEIYEHHFYADTMAEIMHGFRVVAGYIPKDSTLDSSIQITAEDINQAALDTISIHGQDGVFEGEVFRFEVFQGNAKITLMTGDISVFDQGQLNVAIPPTALAKLQAIPGQIHRYKHQIQIQAAKSNQGSSTQVEPKLCKA